MLIAFLDRDDLVPVSVNKKVESLKPERMRKLLHEIEILKRAQLAGRALRPAQVAKLMREPMLRCSLAERKTWSVERWCTWRCSNPLCNALNDADRVTCHVTACNRGKPPHHSPRFQVAWCILQKKVWVRAARRIQSATRKWLKSRNIACLKLQICVLRAVLKRHRGPQFRSRSCRDPRCDDALSAECRSEVCRGMRQELGNGGHPNGVYDLWNTLRDGRMCHCW